MRKKDWLIYTGSLLTKSRICEQGRADSETIFLILMVITDLKMFFYRIFSSKSGVYRLFSNSWSSPVLQNQTNPATAFIPPYSQVVIPNTSNDPLILDYTTSRDVYIAIRTASLRAATYTGRDRGMLVQYQQIMSTTPNSRQPKPGHNLINLFNPI